MTTTTRCLQIFIPRSVDVMLMRPGSLSSSVEVNNFPHVERMSRRKGGRGEVLRC